jgi:hypothetical protein
MQVFSNFFDNKTILFVQIKFQAKLFPLKFVKFQVSKIQRFMVKF